MLILIKKLWNTPLRTKIVVSPLVALAIAILAVGTLDICRYVVIHTSEYTSCTTIGEKSSEIVIAGYTVYDDDHTCEYIDAYGLPSGVPYGTLSVTAIDIVRMLCGIIVFIFLFMCVLAYVIMHIIIIWKWGTEPGWRHVNMPSLIKRQYLFSKQVIQLVFTGDSSVHDCDYM